MPLWKSDIVQSIITKDTPLTESVGPDGSEDSYTLDTGSLREYDAGHREGRALRPFRTLPSVLPLSEYSPNWG